MKLPTDGATEKSKVQPTNQQPRRRRTREMIESSRLSRLFLFLRNRHRLLQSFSFLTAGDKQQLWSRVRLTAGLFVSALTELVDMEGYGHVYIGPFNPALCNAATLFTQHWEAGLAAPGCLAPDWPSLPPIAPPTKVLFTVLRFFRWAHVAVISGAVCASGGLLYKGSDNVRHHTELTVNFVFVSQ